MRIWVGILWLLAFIGFAADKEAWDVNQAFGPTDSVRFETDEATWMTVDISPDGKTLVFDVLGDIYTMSVDGGTAKALTRGLAMDVQPRFSPDGKHISFTSDRGGGDNIWVMDTDGQNPRQVTKESYRLLNNAVWTPDGRFLIARKHFSSRRSLGAGELWMYHSSGGSGIQLTKRKNEQQDLGEPSVSPDGKYVYFSEDVSPGGFFDYNRDPHSGIYAIRRLDLDSGEVETMISGTGGAARPEISPDGKRLAFVRRIAEKTVLHMADLASGALTPLYDGMDHDQQEAWAIFGVYPGFTWLPDGSGLIFWAGGKLKRLDLASGHVSDIPFKVSVESEVIQAVRMTPNLEDQTARVIRDAATSPDGKWLVFSALGSLWKKSLPSGKPTRLTDSNAFEYEPAFNATGTQIVFTQWHDDSQGAVCVVDLKGSLVRTLNTGPGFFYEPSFTPDGKSVVYRKGRGNGLLGYLNQSQQGIYRLDLQGEEAVLISEEGRQPKVMGRDNRVYYLNGWGQRKTYKSVALDGSDVQEHLSLKYVTDVVPSPEGDLIAFREGFNVYVATFPKAGKSFALSAKATSIPVARLSQDVGTNIHWSGKGKKLHWMAGEAYFSKAIAPLPMKKDETKDAAKGISVGLQFALDKPQGVLAFEHARIITMKGDEVLENGTIVVKGNRIVAVGPSDQVNIPKDAKVYSAEGKTIIPGMIDVHGHANHFSSGPSPQTNWAYYANLAFGITALHDPSANTETVFSQSELVRAGKMVGPRIFSTGAILYGADGDGRVVINSLDDAQSHLRRMRAYGAFSVKSYNQPRRNQRQMILKAARDQDVLVVNEGGSTFFHNLTMILDGATGIEHNLPIAPLYRDVIELWAATNVRYTPTLVVGFGGISGEYYWYQHDNIWEHPRIKQFFPQDAIARRSRRRLKIPEAEYYHITVAKSAKALLDKGVKVQVGGHGQLQGLAAHWEMWMLAQGGFTPHEALRAATLHGADYIGLAGQLGSLEKGKLADLIVLDKNPLENIRHSDDIHMVMANGRLYDGETMNEIGHEAKPRGTFFWEKPGWSAHASSVNPWGEGMCHCRPGGAQ